ncbi:MAG TPA: hypothetical protein VEA15_03700 [Caulobacteraceae bacterium]|nr:hypothetical protein [Caulobacteraceae bacterium]
MTVIAISDRLSAAREKLAPAPKAERALPALAAALLAAVTALTLAGAVILGPGVEANPRVTAEIER